MPEPNRAFEEAAHAVDAGEYDPVEGGQIRDGLVEGCDVVGRRGLDGRVLQTVGAQVRQRLDQVAGLLPRTGDDDPSAQQGPVLEPFQFFAQADDLAHHDDGRRLETGVLDLFDDILKPAAHRDLLRGCAPAHQSDRSLRGASVGDELGHDVRQVLHPHEEDEGPDAPGEGGPVDAGLNFGRVFVAGDEGDGGGHLAVAEGDTRVSGCCNGRGDAGHDLEGDAGLHQHFSLLAAAAEHERVAPLQPGDRLVLPGLGHDQGVDLILGQGVVAALLADVDELGPWRSVPEERRCGQIIVDDDVGAGDAFPALDGDQPGVPGSGPHEIDDRCFHVTVLPMQAFSG